MTIERRELVMRLKSVDFPTFGRPTSTTLARREVDFGGMQCLFRTNLDSVSVYIYSIYKT